MIRIVLFLGLAMTIVAGCDSGWGPPRDVSRFGNAVVADGGKTGVFTYKYRIYRPAAGWRAFPDGGPTRDVVNENGIAVYDFATGRTRVLWRQNVMKSRWLPAASCSVTAAVGKTVLATCSGQRRSDYSHDTERFWLDLDSGATTPLPLQEELAARGWEKKSLYLVDEDRTLVLMRYFPEHPQGTKKLEPVRELLVRRPSGDYLRVDDAVYYYGCRNREIHYWSGDGRSRVFNLDSGAYRTGDRREYADLLAANRAGPEVGLTPVYRDGTWRLQVERRAAEGSRKEVLSLTVRDLAAEH
jgi:hypothetical protein